MSQPRSGYWRIACCEPCVVHEPRGADEGFVWNVSVVGAFVVIRPTLNEGDSLVLSFTLPGDSRPIRVEGRVVWQNKPSVSSGCGDRAVRLPPGCGVQFTSLQEPDAQRIDARVRKTYPDAPMVDLTALDSVRRCRKD